MKISRSSFFVTHFRGCAVLFHKHTVKQDKDFKASHIPTDKPFEAVMSGARFQRTPRNGEFHVDVLVWPKRSCKGAQKRKAPSATPDPQVGARRGSSEWTDVCGFVKLPRSPSEWFTRKHGACETNRQELACRLKTGHATSKSGFCERYIAPRTHNTRKHFVACGLRLSPRLHDLKQIVFP